MSSSNPMPVTVVAGAVDDKILANGDREEEYTWVMPSLRSLSMAGPGETPVYASLPKPYFPRGAWTTPSWRENFKAVYATAGFTFKLPYSEPSPRHGEWRVLAAKVEVDGENVGAGTPPVEIQDGDDEGRGRSIHMASPSAWKEKKTMTIKVRVLPFPLALVPIALIDAGWTEKSMVVKMKIFSKRLEGDSNLCRNGDNATIKLNPIILATFNSPELSDVQLVCQGETFLCHKYVLSVGTPVFKRMFLSDTKENQEGKVHIEDVAKDVLRLMLTWMYGEDISPKLKKETLVQRIELYKVADRYLLEELKECIVTNIVRSITVETAFDIYVLGDTYNEDRLKAKGVEVMKKERERVFSNDEVFDECHKRYPKLMQDIEIKMKDPFLFYVLLSFLMALLFSIFTLFILP